MTLHHKAPFTQPDYQQNTAADWQSHLGPVAHLPTTATQEGLRAHHKALRRDYRAQATLGLGSRVGWHRKALSAYTWMRTNRGPQREWLYRIKLKRADSPLCQCGEIQSGDHVTFTCPLHRTARLALLGNGTHTWSTLDTPRYDPDDDGGEDGDRTDLVMMFFSYLFTQLS